MDFIIPAFGGLAVTIAIIGLALWVCYVAVNAVWKRTKVGAVILVLILLGAAQAASEPKHTHTGQLYWNGESKTQ